MDRQSLPKPGSDLSSKGDVMSNSNDSKLGAARMRLGIVAFVLLGLSVAGIAVAVNDKLPEPKAAGNPSAAAATTAPTTAAATTATPAPTTAAPATTAPTPTPAATTAPPATELPPVGNPSVPTGNGGGW
jgi:cytoskeletal protein RodZ